MMAEQQINPEQSEIAAHLHRLTSRWHELGSACLLEIVYLSVAADPATVKQVSHYSITPEADIDAIAADIASFNRIKNINAYACVNPVSAANRPKAGYRASAEHILAAFYQFADADSAEAADRLRNFVGPQWNFDVLTGKTPNARPHVYWELLDPVTDLARWSDMQRTIANTLGTDSVIDPPRIMRLAGTVNWPSAKKIARGYIPEKTVFRDFPSRAPTQIQQLERAFAALPAVKGPTVASTAASSSFTIEATPEAFDREQARVAALSGQEWHNAVIRLVGSYVSRGMSDAEIHTLTDPLTLTGYTVDQTRREVQSAIDGARRKGWTPEPQEPWKPVTESGEPDFPGKPSAVPTTTPAAKLEWFADIQPALTDAYIIKGVLGDGSMSVVYGPSNSGKTFFVLDLVFHVACGLEWRGRRVRQSAVLYLAAEGGRGVANRIVALKQETGLIEAPLALRRAGLDLLRAEADLQAVYDLAKSVRQPDMPLVIVVDTLSRVMAGGDENSAQDMTVLIRNIDAIREATGAHVLLVHHTGKDAARGARGHSSLRAAVDTEIEIQSEDGNRAAYVSKQRDYQGGETFAFTLKSVSLGIDQDGDDVTSCVVEVSDSEEFQAAKQAAKGRGKNQQIIMDTFDQMLGEGLGKPNPGGVGMPEPGQFWAVDLDELRTLSMGKMAGGRASDTFRQAWSTLSEPGGLFCAAQKLAWRVDRRKTQ